MPRILLAPLLVLALLLLPARAARVEEEPAGAGAAKVPAVVYQVWVVEGAMDMIHGGGRWIREIHVPEAGLSFNVEGETLQCFRPDEPRYANPRPGLNSMKFGFDHPARKLGDIRLDREFVEMLQRFLELRAQAKTIAESCFAAAPPIPAEGAK